MSSPKSSPGESRKQNGSRKRKRPSSREFDTNGSAKSKSVRVVRTETTMLFFCRLRFRVLEKLKRSTLFNFCVYYRSCEVLHFFLEIFLSAQVFVHVSFIS